MRRTFTHGPAYSESLDGKRLADQREVIRAFMLNREWLTLREIADDLGYPESSVSAQLRHLRKPEFGLHNVEKRRRAGGLWEYRVRPRPEQPWEPGMIFDISGQGQLI